MLPKTMYLYLTRWRELRGKVKNFESQTVISKYLQIALENRSTSFWRLPDRNFTKTIITKRNRAVCKLFPKSLDTPKKQWSFVFRVGEGINTNMYCESFLRVFKYKYLKGKLNKRVDKCFLNLIKFNRDKIFFVKFSQILQRKV